MALVNEDKFKRARAAGTVEALDEFLRGNASGPLAERARHLRRGLTAVSDLAPREPAESVEDEQKAFEHAKWAGTAEAWEAFLVKHGSGPHAEEAGASLQRLKIG